MIKAAKQPYPAKKAPLLRTSLLHGMSWFLCIKAAAAQYRLCGLPLSYMYVVTLTQMISGAAKLPVRPTPYGKGGTKRVATPHLNTRHGCYHLSRPQQKYIHYPIQSFITHY